MTRINPEDPKWTAYVLGELDDAERAAVELELEASEEARMLVEELRFAAQLTKTELREAVPVTPLTEQQREAIYASAETVRPRRWFTSRQGFWAAGLTVATAAVVVLAVIIAPEQKTTDQLPAATASATAYGELAGQIQPETTAPGSSKPTEDFG